MNALHHMAEKVRRGDPLPWPVGCALRACTPAVRLGMWRRLRQPRVRVQAHVVSFGNITAGGTGKTPAVIERAQRECAAGKRVAVITRGYGGGKVREPAVVPPDASREGLAALMGDEPALIARRAPEVFLVKSADRVAGARAALQRFGCEVLLLDDGFQAVRLERDENILVIDATNPFGNGHLVPRGILREPPEAIRRATEILLTRCDQADETEPLEQRMGAIQPGVPIRRTRHAPSGLWRVADGGAVPLHSLAGTGVRAVCAIGNPEAFFYTLESTGARVTERVAFPDHAPIPPGALKGPGPVVTTEKDAVRMEGAPPAVLALAIALEDLAS